jgi:hypothetical protein
LEGELFAKLKLDIRFEYLVTGPFLIRDGAILEVPADIKIKVKENVGAYIADKLNHEWVDSVRML